MKNKKNFGLMAIVVIVAVAAWNISFGSKTDRLSDIALANVEALAENEIVQIPGREDRFDNDRGCVYQCVDNGDMCYYWEGLGNNC